jgi:histidine ammonia-lyase
MTVILHPGNVTLADLATLYWENGSARLDPSFDAGIIRAADRIAEIASGNAPVYGINTGF